MHEHWHSPEDIEAHFQEDHFKKFAEELQQHLAGPNALSIGKYHSVSSIPESNAMPLEEILKAVGNVADLVFQIS